jgi:hypothetical protein
MIRQACTYTVQYGALVLFGKFKKRKKMISINKQVDPDKEEKN